MKCICLSRAFVSVLLFASGYGWGEWTDYSDCIADGGCGFGVNIRSRLCNDTADPTSCASDDPNGWAMRRSCWIPCVGDMAEWSEWYPWSVCSEPCGPGKQKRVRACIGDMVGAENCTGATYEMADCNVKDCPHYDGGDCYNIKNKTNYRGFISIANNNKPCQPWNHTDSIFQPTDDTYSEANLLDGAFCRNPNNYIKPWCYVIGLDQTLQKRYCTVPSCNIFSKWNDWTNWSSWSTTCGSGKRFRTRTCNNGFIGDPNCIGTAYEEETRDIPCPDVCFEAN